MSFVDSIIIRNPRKKNHFKFFACAVLKYIIIRTKMRMPDYNAAVYLLLLYVKIKKNE